MVGDGAGIAAVGAAAGMVLAPSSVGVLRSLIFGLTPYDATTIMTREFRVTVDRDKRIGASFTEAAAVSHVHVTHDMVYAKPGVKPEVVVGRVGTAQVHMKLACRNRWVRRRSAATASSPSSPSPPLSAGDAGR